MRRSAWALCNIHRFGCTAMRVIILGCRIRWNALISNSGCTQTVRVRRRMSRVRRAHKKRYSRWKRQVFFAVFPHHHHYHSITRGPHNKTTQKTSAMIDYCTPWRSIGVIIADVWGVFCLVVCFVGLLCFVELVGDTAFAAHDLHYKSPEHGLNLSGS